MPETKQDRRRPLDHDPGRLRRMRIKRKLTQQQLADMARISFQQMSALESGKRGTSVESLHRLAGALRCEVDDLMPPEVTS